jgi:ABC-type Fe3+ transport system permease subunit
MINGIQYGVGACNTQSVNNSIENAKRWKFILDTSVIVTAVSGAVIAIGLLIIAGQISKLSKTISKVNKKTE